MLGPIKSHHLTTATIAVAAAVASVVIVTPFLATHKPPPVSVGAGPHNVGHADRWENLTQAELEDIAKQLKESGTRFSVAIFCADASCQDLADDFDTVFEIAGMDSGVETPSVDTNVGINVGPQNDDRAKFLAYIITTATKGRLSPGLVEAHLLQDRIALVISRKQR